MRRIRFLVTGASMAIGTTVSNCLRPQSGIRTIISRPRYLAQRHSGRCLLVYVTTWSEDSVAATVAIEVRKEPDCRNSAEHFKTQYRTRHWCFGTTQPVGWMKRSWYTQTGSMRLALKTLSRSGTGLVFVIGI
jgi:hypothetical protein